MPNLHNGDTECKCRLPVFYAHCLATTVSYTVGGCRTEDSVLDVLSLSLYFHQLKYNFAGCRLYCLKLFNVNSRASMIHLIISMIIAYYNVSVYMLANKTFC